MPGNGGDDPLLRRAKRAARLPVGSACAVCGRPDALVPPRDPETVVLCQDHHRQRRGVSRYDVGHVARQRSWGSLTVLMPASANQRVEDMRRDLGTADSPDPEGDPLLVIADFFEGLAIIGLLLVEYLRALSRHLRGEDGHRYWDGGPEPPVV